MLIDMRVDAERTPSVPRNKEITKPDFSFNLVSEPNPEISPLYLVLHF